MVVCLFEIDYEAISAWVRKNLKYRVKVESISGLGSFADVHKDINGDLSFVLRISECAASPADVSGIIAHELRHCWQAERDGFDHYVLQSRKDLDKALGQYYEGGAYARGMMIEPYLSELPSYCLHDNWFIQVLYQSAPYEADALAFERSFGRHAGFARLAEPEPERRFLGFLARNPCGEVA